MIDHRKRIGKRIADLRKAKKLTQQEVADRTGIDAKNMSRIEKGKYNVGFDTLQKIAEALHMNVDII